MPVISTTSTSTGNFGPVNLPRPVSKLSVATVHGSTKQVSWKIQGDIGAADAWTDLIAATSSTGSAISTTTAGHVVTRVRIQVTGNGTTGNVTSYWHIAGVP